MTAISILLLVLLYFLSRSKFIKVTQPDFLEILPYDATVARIGILLYSFP